jgi:hypothetical protein
MRIWDVPVEELCRAHLLGEHRELHGLWNIITQDKKGYSQHPETKRWVGRQAALYKRHENLVEEMRRRGYNHTTPLDISLAIGEPEQTVFINTIEEQTAILRDKPCDCYI